MWNISQMIDVVLSAGIKVVDPKHIVAIGDMTVTKGGSREAGTPVTNTHFPDIAPIIPRQHNQLTQYAFF